MIIRRTAALLAAALALAVPEASASGPEARSLGTIQVGKPAFLALVPFQPGEAPTLVISSFRMFGRDTVRTVPAVGEFLEDLGAVRPTLLTDRITWPNETDWTPGSIFGFDALTVSSGFLVPGKNRGAVSVLPLRDGAAFWAHEPIRLSPDMPGWFYHRAVWRDMDGDGAQDVITARARKPMMGAGRGKLVWLRNPGRQIRENAADGIKVGAAPSWEEQVLAEGPDVHFRLEDLDGDGTEEVLATEFFGKRLSVSWFEGGEGPLASRGLRRRVIDAQLGSAFDLELVDLDGDGRRDLLVTNHEPDEKAAVFAYEIPDDFRNEAWPRHTLIEGIETRQGGPKQASPGRATAFHPRPAEPGARPWILVSGDGSQRAHLLVPEEGSRWAYREETLVDVGGTVGLCLAEDVDGDGYTEIFVPSWNKDEIHVFTFAPATGVNEARP
jgi:hypothetical protein